MTVRIKFQVLVVAIMSVKNTLGYMGGVHPPFGVPPNLPSTHLKKIKDSWNNFDNTDEICLSLEEWS